METVVYVTSKGYFSNRQLIDISTMNPKDYLGKTLNGIKKYKRPFLKLLKNRDINFLKKLNNDE